MTDMSRLGKDFAGVHFKNNIIPASGTLGYGSEFEEYYPLSELGGISVKGTTGQRRTGNLPPRIAETPSGMLNSVGLQNPGIDHFIAEELPYLKTKETVVIANIAGSTAEEYAEIARKLDSTDVDMIEVNISCPNVKAGGAAFVDSSDRPFAPPRIPRALPPRLHRTDHLGSLPATLPTLHSRVRRRDVAGHRPQYQERPVAAGRLSAL